ncbi:nitroreductase family protein [Saccharicrinis fermentans]|uniref:Ferredoxin n=1 Tax=Saccharicrinis fermentans DSM 9555 = JCM 21142 TaxID=869213 RepID=W7Y5X4_9BACT|nr:nitroreductase family protein [Saccharicrinis fermentans]GAF03008.1 ferredoxin [Saccharicrinis fermentans DSM 9555 = JCM 21142]
MLDFRINESLCTRCGICSKECPTLIIDGANGIPEIKEGKEKNCIKCQHCLAVCPTGALSIFGKKPENSLPTDSVVPSYQELDNLIKTRRSVRKFKKEELSGQELDELLASAAYAPTGHNKNQVLFSLTYNREQLANVREMVYDAIKKEKANLSPSLAMYGSFQSLWETKGIDILLRDAPHLIVTSAPESNPNCVADCVISMSYFELLANTKGIGTLWDGLLKVVFEHIAPELKVALGIPEDHKIGYMMVFGKPAVKFARSIQSEGLNKNIITV